MTKNQLQLQITALFQSYKKIYQEKKLLFAPPLTITEVRKLVADKAVLIKQLPKTIRAILENMATKQVIPPPNFFTTKDMLVNFGTAYTYYIEYLTFAKRLVFLLEQEKNNSYNAEYTTLSKEIARLVFLVDNQSNIHDVLSAASDLLKKSDISLHISALYIGDVHSGLPPQQAREFPFVNNYLQKEFGAKFVENGKLRHINLGGVMTIGEAYKALTGMTDKEIVEMLSSSDHMPSIALFDYQASNLFSGKINGSTEVSHEGAKYDEFGKKKPVSPATIITIEAGDPRGNGTSGDRKGVILLDTDLARALEFTKGGNSSFGKSNDLANESMRTKATVYQTAEQIVESTLLHEFVHWARMRKKLDDKLTQEEGEHFAEITKQRASQEPGKVFEMLVYGHDIKKRLNPNNLNDPTEFEDIDHDSNEKE